MTTARRLAPVVALVALLGCADDPSRDHPDAPDPAYHDLGRFGKVTSECIDGFRVFIADHVQVGYGIDAEPDPACPRVPS